MRQIRLFNHRKQNTESIPHKRRYSFFLILFLLLSCMPYSIAHAELTSDTIKQKEKEISEVNKTKQNLQSGLTDIKQVLKDLETSKSNLNSYVKQLDSTLNTIEAKLDSLKEQIDAKLLEIQETKIELAKAEARSREQYQSMKERIRFLYERGNTFYLEIMLSADTFGDLLNKADYIEKLSAYDRKKLDEFKATGDAIAAYKTELEEEQEILETARIAAQQEQESMNTLISSKEQEINLYESDISNKEQVVEQYEAEIAAQNAELAALEKAVAEEKKRLAEANGSIQKYDGGQFAFPAPSYKRISDDYGYRTHPILKIQQFHNGVDLASPNGSPILAAYDGTVVQATYSNTMGNYIMIDHGDGLYTIYMHASALYVEKGSVVTKGQKIAAVGSTGRSTGPHLHFSVRLNGSYVSPWNYLG
ncbi:MAG: peptidoglycan DD-metalloendopeptidase family protein [Lachnospiraceae bacterium]